VSFFMNKFRKLGFIDYNGGMEVHSSLLNVVLHDSRKSKLNPALPSNAIQTSADRAGVGSTRSTTTAAG